jgi:hypothetical protein
MAENSNVEAQRRYRESNREKCNEASRLSRQRHPLTEVEGHLKRKYGMTLEQYETQVANQHGLCAICGGTPSGKDKKLAVDHNHKNKRRRGLLCDRCNTGLGLFKESIVVLVKATWYLVKWYFAREKS